MELLLCSAAFTLITEFLFLSLNAILSICQVRFKTAEVANTKYICVPVCHLVVISEGCHYIADYLTNWFHIWQSYYMPALRQKLSVSILMSFSVFLPSFSLPSNLVSSFGEPISSCPMAVPSHFPFYSQAVLI